MARESEAGMSDKYYGPLETHLVEVPESHREILDNADLACTHIQQNGPWADGKEVTFYNTGDANHKIVMCSACAEIADKADLSMLGVRQK